MNNMSTYVHIRLKWKKKSSLTNNAFCIIIISIRGGLNYPKPDYLTRAWLFFCYLSLTRTWLLAIWTWLEPDYDTWQIVVKYRIRVYKTPLLIKPPLQENSKKIPINRHFFAQKSNFWGFLEQKMENFLSHFNKPPPQNPNFFIRRRRLIDADTVVKKWFFLLKIHTTLYKWY